jgi:hypothetical protein
VDPTFPRQSTHRWRWGCQPYAPSALFPSERFLVFLSEAEPTPRPQWGWKNEVFKKKSCDLIGNRLCGLVVRVPGYRSRDPGSIPGATRFSDKQWVWNGVYLASWVQFRSYLEVAAPAQKSENTAVGDPQLWLRDTHLPAKVGTNFADKRRSLGRYSSPADSGHWVCLLWPHRESSPRPFGITNMRLHGGMQLCHRREKKVYPLPKDYAAYIQ